VCHLNAFINEVNAQTGTKNQHRRRGGTDRAGERYPSSTRLLIAQPATDRRREAATAGLPAITAKARPSLTHSPRRLQVTSRTLAQAEALTTGLATGSADGRLGERRWECSVSRALVTEEWFSQSRCGRSRASPASTRRHAICQRMSTMAQTMLIAIEHFVARTV
jgi:hypothetical protein